MKHGDELTFSTLGAAQVIEVNSILSSSFGYHPSPVEITASSSLLICFERFYIILETASQHKISLLYPVVQGVGLTDFDTAPESFSPLKSQHLLEVGRIAMAGIHQDPWSGVCLRSFDDSSTLCSFQLLDRNFTLDRLEETIIAVVDLGLAVFEEALCRTSQNQSGSGLALSVLSLIHI